MDGEGQNILLPNMVFAGFTRLQPFSHTVVALDGSL